MGEVAQKRLVRKLDLERFLSKVKPHSSPDVNLEQYTLSESAAATMLYLTAYTYSGIIGKRVVDLGCGTGRLALGAAFLGAENVVGVDIDKDAIKTAEENSKKAGFHERVNWVAGDIDALAGHFDTVLQNPPFGVQRRNADRRFLQKSLDLADSIFSLHNHPNTDKRLISMLKASGGQPLQIEASPFLSQFIEKLGGKVEGVYALLFVIPHMFDFHTKAKHEIVIDFYVISRNSN